MQIDAHVPVVFPASPAPVAQDSGNFPIGLFGLGLVLIVVAGVVFSHRRARRMDPRELAFRKIVHKLGYSRSQIKKLRQSSIKAGLSSPVGLVMSPSICAHELLNGSQ